MFRVADFWFGVQHRLFPHLEACLPPDITDRLREFILILEVIRIEQYGPNDGGGWLGRRRCPRHPLARALVAKAFYNLPTTEELWERLHVDEALRQVCGWERRKQVPSLSTFSRAFGEFAASGLLDRVHEALVADYTQDTVIWHVSRDSTAIEGRERPALRPKAAPAEAGADPAPPLVKRKPGRPRKGEHRPPPEPTRLERQYATPLTGTAQLIAELPTACDGGCKRDTENRVMCWDGYKFHVDTGDTGLPLFALTTSASLHDGQTAIPMARMTAQRVVSLYSLMDSAYDAKPIRDTEVDLGHVPIIDKNRRSGPPPLPMEPDRARRFDHRTASERFNSDLKDNHGGRTVRVRGQPKVHTHLMLGLVVIFAKVVLGWT